MSQFTDSLRWLMSPAIRADQRLPLILNRFRNPDEQTLTLLEDLVACFRPTWHGEEACVARYEMMVDMLERDPLLQDLFRQRVVSFIASRRLVTFFTDSGLLPDTGFFSEWWRILVRHVLPPACDERRLKDCLALIYRKSDDWQWMEAIPEALSERLWRMLSQTERVTGIDWGAIREQLLNAILLLAHRVSGLGVDAELMRAAPDFEHHLPRFVALSAEALAFVSQSREQGDMRVLADFRPLLVIVDQCYDTLERIRKRAQAHGTSLHLTYQLTRGRQNLERLRELVALLTGDEPALCQDSGLSLRSHFTRRVFIAESRRNSLSDYLGQLSGLLAMRVTSNAARSGEHYICATPHEYRHMWLSAAGAGVVIAIMALLKIFASELHAPLFVEALMFSLIYGLGFVLIYLLGMTVATKQPAMTAQTIAALLSDLRPRRAAEVERLVDVIAAVGRSQLAAILGNVLLALPVALGVGYLFSHLTGNAVVSPEKSAKLLADLDPLTWALPHAAIAGFYLFLSGLISGYFDNHATYASIGPRIAKLSWLRFVFGEHLAQRCGAYIQCHLGGVMGNFLFGCMLGSTGVLGIILGLPLDIRHIAFASAGLGYAVVGSDFSIPLNLVLYSALGVALIGLTNLAVSFALALRTALWARDVRFGHGWPIVRAIARRLWRQPRSFVMPVPSHH